MFQLGRLLPGVSMRELARAGRRVWNSSTTPEEVLQTQIEPVNTGNQRGRGSKEQPHVDAKSREKLGIKTESS